MHSSRTQRCARSPKARATSGRLTSRLRYSIQHVLFVRVHRHFQADRVGVFAERSHVGYQHRAVPGRAPASACRNSRQPSDSADSARCRRPRCNRRNLRAACTPSTRTCAPRSSDRISARRGKSWCGSPTRIIFAVGSTRNRRAECPQRFRDSLVRLQEAEHADQRRKLIQAQPLPVGLTVRLGDPGAMRYARDRARETCGAQASPSRNRYARSPPSSVTAAAAASARLRSPDPLQALALVRRRSAPAVHHRISTSRRYASQSPRLIVMSAIRWCRFAS